MYAVNSPNGIIDGEWNKNANTVFQNGDSFMSYYNNKWLIMKKNTIIAYSLPTFGLHPCTIRPAEWLFVYPSILTISNFMFKILANTQDNPYSMSDIGIDYFTRVTPTRPIWFINPLTKNIEHSGAKEQMQYVIKKKRKCYNHVLGKRYCWVCEKSFSANNFKTQHIDKFHSVPRTLNTMHDVCAFILHN